MKTKKLMMMAAIWVVTDMASMMLVHAAVTSSTGTTTKKNVETISPELAAELAAVEQLPTVEPSTLPYGGRGATYHSAQYPFWPALPANVFGLPVWDLGDGQYLIDDLSLDYSALDTTATTTTAMSMSLSSVSLLGGGFSPMTLQQQSGVPFLTIAPTGTNGIYSITVLNDQGPANYELWYTPVLANPAYPWTAVAAGASGQTNFTVNINVFPVFPTGFYRAIWDTNSIPAWQAANPANPGAGILSVFIDSPTNGTIIQ